MKSFFQKSWLRFSSFNKIQKTFVLSLLTSILLVLVAVFINQSTYDKRGMLIISLLLISSFIAGVSLIIMLLSKVGRILSNRIHGNEKLNKLGFMNSKILFLYALIAFFISIGAMLLGLAKSSTIFAILLSTVALLSAGVCSLIFIKFIFHFNFVRKLFTFGILGIVLFFLVYLFIGRPHSIYGNSMLPGLADRSYLLTTKVPYYLSEPKRGDVIVFTTAISSTDEFISRIIGLPGETISIKNGDVYINGQVLVENYLFSAKSTRGGAFLEEMNPFSIPADNYFVMGDNRENSNDSRAWGTIKKSAISGKAWIRHWPLKEFGTKVN